MDLEASDKIEDTGEQTSSQADEAALDLVKQLITLAAGVLALSATFIEKIGSRPHGLLAILGVSWMALITSVFSGLQTMSVIVKSRLTGIDEWSRGRGKSYAQISKYCFVAGITLFALFAFLLLTCSSPEPERPPKMQNTSSLLAPAPRSK